MNDHPNQARVERLQRECVAKADAALLLLAASAALVLALGLNAVFDEAGPGAERGAESTAAAPTPSNAAQVDP